MQADYRIGHHGNLFCIEVQPNARALWHPLVEWSQHGPRVKTFAFESMAELEVCVIADDMYYWWRKDQLKSANGGLAFIPDGEQP
jgi:hypothetical protein